MVLDVLGHEGAHEEVAVVIALQEKIAELITHILFQQKVKLH